MDDWAAQLEACRSYLIGVAYRRVRDRDAADDLVSETITKAFEHRASYRPGNLRGWLTMILRRLIVDATRTRGRLLWRDDSYEEAIYHASAQWAGRDPADIVADRDLIRRVMANIAPRYRRVLVAVACGYSYREAASLLGVSELAMNPLVWRARQAVLQVGGR